MILSVQVVVMLIGVWTYKKISVMVDVTPKILERKRLLYEIWEGGVTVFKSNYARGRDSKCGDGDIFYGAFMVSFFHW